MATENGTGSTRRQSVAGGLGAASGLLLAGCAQSDATHDTPSGGGSTDRQSGGSYSVSMSPVGDVTFDGVGDPELEIEVELPGRTDEDAPNVE